MSFLQKFFKPAQKALKAFCPITKERIENGFGYLLTTAEVVSSQKYWDMIMTEPETLSYTISHFKSDQSGTMIRTMIFDKYSAVDTAWLISDSCIGLFESVDKDDARQLAKSWWEMHGELKVKNIGAAKNVLSPEDYGAYRDYAILEAGREKALNSSDRW